MKQEVAEYIFKYPELYQFFAGYFYQGWAADYRWEGTLPNSAAVVSHFKAVNPPLMIGQVRNRLEDLMREETDEEKLGEILYELGSSFFPPSEKLNNRQWLEKISDILNESPTKARILRELK